jgi:hypothetical protein
MTKALMTRILLATDFSDGAACAQDYAVYLASHWGATLEILHVIEAPHRPECRDGIPCRGYAGAG